MNVTIKLDSHWPTALWTIQDYIQTLLHNDEQLRRSWATVKAGTHEIILHLDPRDLRDLNR